MSPAELPVDGDVRRALDLCLRAHMHAHAAHEGQRPHQDGIHAKFAADAAGFIQTDGVGLHPATAFLGQQCVQDGSKPTACLCSTAWA